MKHTISVLVENHAGVLSRITGLFSRRGFNIDSLAVGVTEDKTVSRMTIVVEGDAYTVEQLEKQLNKVVDVIKVRTIPQQDLISRELMLIKCTATGNGRLDAVATAIEQQTGMHFTLVHYSEHALDSDTNSRACSYVGLKWASGEETWGCGTHTDIIVAGIKALVSAINNK